MPGGHLHREKVRGREHLPVHLQELCPTHTGLASVWSRLHMVAAQDVTHGALVDMMSQVRECSLDAAVAPGGILLGHLDGEPLDFLRH